MEGQTWWALLFSPRERGSNLRGREDRRTALQAPSPAIPVPSSIFLGSSVQGQATAQVSSAELEHRSQHPAAPSSTQQGSHGEPRDDSAMGSSTGVGHTANGLHVGESAGSPRPSGTQAVCPAPGIIPRPTGVINSDKQHSAGPAVEQTQSPDSIPR